MPATLLSRHVATFLQCARSRSFTRAAAQLSISPTALIAQLDLFEARLGFKLFERTHRGLKLTVQGQSLFEDAQRLELEAQGAVRRAYLAGLEDNSLTVGTSPVVPGTLAVALWQEVHSSLNLRLVPFDNTPLTSRNRYTQMSKPRYLSQF